jgi:hypothetical protein
VFDEPRAARARALGERLCHIGGIGARIAREMKRRGQVRDIGQRPHRSHALRIDFVALDTKRARDVHPASHFRCLGRRRGQLDRAAGNHARGLAGLGFKPPVEILRVLG